MSRKRKSSNSASLVFSTIQELDSEDRRQKKKFPNNKNNASRTKAAVSQTRLYQHLMECRILMQPQLKKQRNENGSQQNNEEQLELCNAVLRNLLIARQKLLLGKDAQDEDNNHYLHLVQDASRHDELQDVLEEEYNACREDWKEVLNRRHVDLKLQTGKSMTAKTQFKVMDSSFWEQVTATTNHEVMRNNQGNRSEEHDVVHFNDSKLYQYMLQDFLSSSNGSNGDTQNKNNRRVVQNSKRKNVDRRATKGRKLRYAIHPKIVNFTFPVQRLANSSSIIMDQDEWFASLFGGAAHHHHNNKKRSDGSRVN